MVHLWYVDLTHCEVQLANYTRTLSAPEAVRARNFVMEDKRKRFIAAHVVLRELIGDYLDYPPADLEFSKHPKGKPALSGEAAQSGLMFNVSYTQSTMAIAIGGGREIGVDIERLGLQRDVLAIARRFFSRAEFDNLAHLPTAQRDSAFLTAWTRKEAVMKAHGAGMVLLDKIESGFEDGPLSKVISIDDQQFIVMDVAAPVGCRCAIARTGEAFDVVQRKLN